MKEVRLYSDKDEEEHEDAIITAMMVLEDGKPTRFILHDPLVYGYEEEGSIRLINPTHVTNGRIDDFIQFMVNQLLKEAGDYTEVTPPEKMEQISND